MFAQNYTPVSVWSSSSDILDRTHELPKITSGHQAQDDASLAEFYDLWPRPILSPSFESCCAGKLSLPKTSHSIGWGKEPSQSPYMDVPPRGGWASTQQQRYFGEDENVISVDSQQLPTIPLSRALASSASLPGLIPCWDDETGSSFAHSPTFFNADAVSRLLVPTGSFSDRKSLCGIMPRWVSVGGGCIGFL
jgi:hypothetical protein